MEAKTSSHISNVSGQPNGSIGTNGIGETDKGPTNPPRTGEKVDRTRRLKKKPGKFLSFKSVLIKLKNIVGSIRIKNAGKTDPGSSSTPRTGGLVESAPEPKI